jgi:hypothetical protein
MKKYTLFWNDIYLGVLTELNYDQRSSGSLVFRDFFSLKAKYEKLYDFVQHSISQNQYLENGDEGNYEKSTETDNLLYPDFIDSKDWYLLDENYQKIKILCPIFHSENEAAWLIDIEWIKSSDANKDKLFYEELLCLDSLNEPNRRTKLSIIEIDEIANEYKGVPQEYLNYLLEIGYGEIREYSLNFFSGLVTLNDLDLEEHYPVGKNIQYFCTDFCGDMIGFDTFDNFNIVQLDHELAELRSLGTTFRELIRNSIEESE